VEPLVCGSVSDDAVQSIQFEKFATSKGMLVYIAAQTSLGQQTVSSETVVGFEEEGDGSRAQPLPDMKRTEGWSHRLCQLIYEVEAFGHLKPPRAMV
jgi:hypothetical protein